MFTLTKWVSDEKNPTKGKEFLRIFKEYKHKNKVKLVKKKFCLWEIGAPSPEAYRRPQIKEYRNLWTESY